MPHRKPVAHVRVRIAAARDDPDRSCIDLPVQDGVDVDGHGYNEADSVARFRAEIGAFTHRSLHGDVAFNNCFEVLFL